MEKVPIISIIDDDDSVRAATKNLVRSIGFRAYTFTSAENFLQSSYVNDTSCLISDIQMPNMSGVELQSRLAAKGHLIPIIFITAFPDEGVRARAMKAGAVCFLHKPCDGETLIKQLDAALKQHRGQSEA